jgi:hypothetical protein
MAAFPTEMALGNPQLHGDNSPYELTLGLQVAPRATAITSACLCSCTCLRAFKCANCFMAAVHVLRVTNYGKRCDAALVLGEVA